jgi:hypothetical protein
MYFVIELGASLLLFAVLFLCLAAIVIAGLLVWPAAKYSVLWLNPP